MASKREVRIFITADATGVGKAVGEVESKFGRLGGVLKGAIAGVGFAALSRGALNAARDFQDMALAANDFATASGLSVEQASRWQEVASDLGVDANKLQGALGRLSKGLGADAKKWEDYGVVVAQASDGTVDANKTFLNAVDALKKIENPLDRAKVGSELFGRSWQDLAPLVELGAEDLAVALNEVGDAQVINEDEVEKAKRFRDQMDLLNDTTMGFKLTLAEALMPVLATFAGWAAEMDPKLLALIATTGGVIFVVGKLGGAITGVTQLLSIFAAHPVMVGALAVVAGLAIIIDNWDKVSAAIQGAIDKVNEFFQTISKPIQGPIKGIANFFGISLGPDPARARSNLTPEASRLAAQYRAGRASGGPVGAGMPYLVGERGPELFVPAMSGAIVANGAGMGAPVYITVNPAPGMNEVELARAVAREQQRLQRAKGTGVAP
jgi:hypothetical protein